MLSPLGLSELRLREEQGPSSLSDGGWRTLALRPASGTSLDMGPLKDCVEQLAEALANAVGDEVLCVYVDPADGYARASLRSTAGFPRSSEGDTYQVLRQAANWLDSDPIPLLRFFASAEKVNTLSAALNLGEGLSAEKESQAEQDEEDKFIETKLKFAREQMDLYLRRRKP